MPLSSPEHLNGHGGESEPEDLDSEQPPPAMSELACEALTEELKQMQVTLSGAYNYWARGVVGVGGGAASHGVKQCLIDH